MTKAWPSDQELETKALDAAARVFRRKGFAAATVREIAESAGMLPGSLHYRFRSKEALLLRLVESAVDSLTVAISTALQDGGDDPVDRLRLALRAHLRLLLSGDETVHALLYDARSLEGAPAAAMTRLRDRYERVWTTLLEDAARSGRLRPDIDLKLLRTFGFGAINGIARSYLPSGNSKRRAVATDAVADAAWSFIAHGILDHQPRSRVRAVRG